jgi:hypothetical protein
MWTFTKMNRSPRLTSEGRGSQRYSQFPAQLNWGMIKNKKRPRTRKILIPVKITGSRRCLSTSYCHTLLDLISRKVSHKCSSTSASKESSRTPYARMYESCQLWRPHFLPSRSYLTSCFRYTKSRNILTRQCTASAAS